MQGYSIIVTLHILTATGMFMAWAAEWVVGNMRGSSSQHAETANLTRIYLRVVRIGMIAMVSTILSGIFLMVKTWGPQPWITATIINLTGIIAVGLTIGKRDPKAVMAFKLVLGLVILLLMSLKADAAVTTILTVIGWVGASLLLQSLRVRG